MAPPRHRWKSAGIIAEYGLPETHFTMAFVVNGCFSAMVEGEKVDFFHFPLFLHGTGRHEGDWQLEMLRTVLADTSRFIAGNTQEGHDETGWTECMED
ncbi:MAG: hypothetical protein AVO35_12550 [Candidatus Aegiribacteria sp. MLS_C]|nr:MAG: hypothetical protein AVO35_12550 [Candidatus Aegiribacteria sp. MLS_C]